MKMCSATAVPFRELDDRKYLSVFSETLGMILGITLQKICARYF